MGNFFKCCKGCIYNAEACFCDGVRTRDFCYYSGIAGQSCTELKGDKLVDRRGDNPKHCKLYEAGTRKKRVIKVKQERKCKRCGEIYSKLGDESGYCPKCREERKRKYCKECGKPLPKDSKNKYCDECGERRRKESIRRGSEKARRIERERMLKDKVCKRCGKKLNDTKKRYCPTCARLNKIEYQRRYVARKKLEKESEAKG